MFFYTAFLLADTYQLDVKEMVSEKLLENEAKYPESGFKGSNKKYDEKKDC